METTIQGLGFRVILGLYGDNGKENGNYRDYRGYIGFFLMGVAIGGMIRVILGLYRDNGKENGNYCPGFRV